MNNQQKYLTPVELAERLRRPEGTIRNWRWRGFGPKWVKLGKHVLYPLDEVEKWELERVMG